jgi:hypothetical protein
MGRELQVVKRGLDARLKTLERMLTPVSGPPRYVIRFVDPDGPDYGILVIEPDCSTTWTSFEDPNGPTMWSNF